MRKLMSVFGVAVLFALAAGPAMAAKVELPKANGRIIPAVDRKSVV